MCFSRVKSSWRGGRSWRCEQKGFVVRFATAGVRSLRPGGSTQRRQLRPEGRSKCKNLMSAQVASKSGVAENPRESAARAEWTSAAERSGALGAQQVAPRRPRRASLGSGSPPHDLPRGRCLEKNFVKEFAGRCSETRSMVKTRIEEPGAVARTQSRSKTALELERFDTVIGGTPRRNQTAWTLRNILRVTWGQWHQSR